MEMNPKTFSQLLKDTIQLWRRFSLPPRAPASLAAVVAFEKQYSVTLPDQIRQYFLVTDGMEADVDTTVAGLRAVRFWPIAEVKLITNEVEDPLPYTDCYLFADYLLWSHGYAIHLGQKGVGEVVLVGGPTPRRVAQSFSEFLAKYLDSPDEIL